jgi:hypothetical protein
LEYAHWVCLKREFCTHPRRKLHCRYLGVVFKA